MLVDPFLKPNNPAAVATAEEVEPTHIAISHGHADHMADAVPVAKRTGAHCVAIVELANWLEAQGVEAVSDPNLGGTVSFDWGWIKLVPAWHTNTIPGSEEAPFSAEHGISIGTPSGLVINDRRRHRLPRRRHLPVRRHEADRRTQPGRRRAAADRRPLHDGPPRRRRTPPSLVGAGTVIPMHYDTFPPIETDAEAFKADVESQTSSKVVVLKPGDTFAL